MISLCRIASFWFKLLPTIVAPLLFVFVITVATWPSSEKGTIISILLNSRFLLSLLLGILSVLAGMFTAWWLAGRFVTQVYLLDGVAQGARFLLRSRFGNPDFAPWMRITQGRIDPGGAPVLSRIGGPGHLVLYNDSAAVLERGGVFTRVVGKGFPALAPFERVYDVIDLRPKSFRYSIGVVTAEGLPITWTVEIHYQISDGGQAATLSNPYPFSEPSVFLASTSKWRRQEGFAHGQDMNWEGLVVVHQTETTLRSIVAHYTLDETLDPDYQKRIQGKLKEVLSESLPRIGAQLCGIELFDIELEESLQQWIEKQQIEQFEEFVDEGHDREQQMRMGRDELLVAIDHTLAHGLPDEIPSLSASFLKQVADVLCHAVANPKVRDLLTLEARANLEQLERLAGGESGMFMTVGQPNSSTSVDMAQSPSSDIDIRILRQLLREAFTTQLLRQFCQDRSEFRPVLAWFGEGASLNEMIETLIEYCGTRMLFNELLTEVEDCNPKQFDRYRNQLYGDDSVS